jgi:hypothetical protein
MAGERPDYRALQAIPDRNNPTRSAYQTGEYLHAQVVQDWGLIVGVDVEALRPEQMAKPAGNARRDEWATYALGQGLSAEEVDGMGRDELRAHFTEQAAEQQSDESGVAPETGE